MTPVPERHRWKRILAHPFLLHYKCSASVSAATCLQYALLWVIALWIVSVCVCVHACAPVSFCSPGEDPQCSGECPAADVPEVPAVPGAVWGESGMCHLILCMLHQPLHPTPTPNTDIILHKSSWQARPVLIYYASSVECASAHPYCLSHTKSLTNRDF